MTEFKEFQSNPKTVKAAPFEWGMEDGVRRFNEIIPKDAGDKSSYPEESKSKRFPGYHVTYDDLLEDRGFERGQWQPYVITLQRQEVVVSEGDWIILESDGVHKYPCQPDEFEKNYRASE